MSMSPMEGEDMRSNSTLALHPSDATTSRKARTKKFCKRIFKFLFSHIGLVAMVIIYTVLGGFLFELLEQHEERRVCEVGKGYEAGNVTTLKAKLITYIQFNITANPTDTTKDNETLANEKIETWLVEFRDTVLDLKSNFKYSGDCSKPKWNLPGALLFAVTVITTIGYGHITPATWEGQVVCICYATIGIPLFLMCISNISGVLGDIFRFLYSRVCCGLCASGKTKKNGQYADSVGDSSVESAGMSAPVSARGITPAWVDPSQARDSSAKHQDDDIDDKYADYAHGDDEEEKVTVPLTVTMIIITGYLIIGAIIFNQFEKWSPIQAGYFCYITLSTIGFGDFVPGQGEDDPDASIKLIAGAVYILFGISIIGMCFDLMQEEIIAKFTWLGKKLGIVDNHEEKNGDIDLEESEDTLTERDKIKKDTPPGASTTSKRLKSSFTNESFTGDAIIKSNRTSPPPLVEGKEIKSNLQRQQANSKEKKVY